ncbi:YcnI family protein [Massilia sp. R2A-15]|uniref:YcnI family protein n=1 Tax=Massilia sp. R2A-15 TaxID=3064278 RepID=UPI002732573F|nr:YcnI family protein [Massilia sp. R2A-15]WLI90488.1 YcnI family protein [Massilia sp. R2A-15]
MKSSTLLIAALLAAPMAHAHITIEQTSAPAGAYQKLTFRVGHGCEGSATSGITVILPEAIARAKPMPKAGWAITIGERDVSWKGGPLPDAQYDEFVMQVKLPAAAGKQVFKVIQQCEKGRAEWTPAFDVMPPQ